MTLFHMIKNLRRVMIDMFKTRIELLEMKTTISEMKIPQKGLTIDRTLQKKIL